MVDQIRKWRDTCEVASRAIEKIAASFEKVEDRSQRLFAAIEDLGLLTPMQMIDVFEAMCKDQYKIDVFMGLPESLRRPYVLRILEESEAFSVSIEASRSLKACFIKVRKDEGMIDHITIVKQLLEEDCASALIYLGS
ncbi:hypothetical protein Patl1_19513 [Pistacia atlantica]|uniref:Uncharacterized protein n=1 Tax=Pistacia atlantica TaxID=434234 RepID=A0ACC1C025_9ROSI|nr:hypothetical protein Patl1_19513 [Pistacia atlantica]